ncbi:LamB/YcsF family protein [Haloactinomyces albus]|uniref:LamB/YcsF family protein n=1 Tax=Haloactinomyces albus TaxID=1352928 RepID=UPI0035B55D34
MDVNADLAEGFGRWELGDDAALLDVVTSANVACGFHAGDPNTLRDACTRAARGGVALGAQVAYRDLAGFGRRFIDIAPEDLTNDVIYQIGALAGFARVAGTEITYVKPHGALYHAVGGHSDQAAAVVEAIRCYDSRLAVLGSPGSRWLELAGQAGLPVYREAFADRAYNPDGTLVSRRAPGALLHDPERIAQRCSRLARGEEIEAVDGSMIRVRAESICVHGDTPDAVAIAHAVRGRLETEGIELVSFAPAPVTENRSPGRPWSDPEHTDTY